jgi:hypothetical protein
MKNSIRTEQRATSTTRQQGHNQSHSTVSVTVNGVTTTTTTVTVDGVTRTTQSTTRS